MNFSLKYVLKITDVDNFVEVLPLWVGLKSTLLGLLATDLITRCQPRANFTCDSPSIGYSNGNETQCTNTVIYTRVVH